MVNCAPEVAYFAVDFDENFVDVPTPVGIIPAIGVTFFSKMISDKGSKSVPLIPDSFIADIDAPFC